MEWIDVNENLPQLKHTMGCGNKYSDDCLVTDGEECYVANLEAVRPDFEKQLWNITQSDELVKEYSGKDVTHWMELPKLPSVLLTKIINKMKKRTDYSTPIEYKILSGRPLLILKRKIGDKLTVPCPFCGTGHQHGTGDGHRVAHCATGSKEFVTAPDGTKLYEKDGYVLVSINELPISRNELSDLMGEELLLPDDRVAEILSPNTKTYVFASKNSSASMILSASSEKEAWTELEGLLKDNHDFRLSEIEDED